MLGLQYFSFTDMWNLWEMAIAFAVIVLYYWLIGPKRSSFADSKPVSAGKQALFVSGVLIHYVSVGGPLNFLGHLMFSAHMTAMSFAYLVAPPLILLGIPGWLVRPLLTRRITGPIIRGLTQPLISVLVFNVMFSFYHVPGIHDYVMTNFFVHRVFFVAMLIAAFMMWWPILMPTPQKQRLSELKKMAYIFANGVLITPACALIIFAGTPVYATYNDPLVWAEAMGYCMPGSSQALLEAFSGPEQFSILGATEDQQLGGVVMKIMQEITYGLALAYTFFSWYSRERAKDEKESESVLPNPAQ